MTALPSRLLALFALLLAGLVGPQGGAWAQVARYDDTDFTTGQMSTFEASSFEQCAAGCLNESLCKAFTYKDRFKQCYLHSTAAAPAKYPGAVSGIVSSRLGGAGAAPGGVIVVPAAQGTSCSIASTAKCPGCTVTCQGSQKAECTPSSDGILEACLSHARCECKGG